MTMKSLLSTVSLALLLGGAAATAQAQIAIGHLADYSGGTSDVGTPYGQAVADTFAWVNKNGGVGGKQLVSTPTITAIRCRARSRSTRNGPAATRSRRSWAGAPRIPRR